MDKSYVFNIGFNRSGTTSLVSALNILGIPSLHYSIDESWWRKNNTQELEFIINENKKQGLKYFHTLDNTYQGFSDFYGEIYYKDLYKQYPNSKFILTIRPPEDWISSVITTERNQRRFYSNTKGEYKAFKRKIDHYFKKRDEIREFFKDNPNQYLEMNICDGDGWKVLCNFLGKEIPKTPFPFENQREKPKRHVKRRQK